MSRRLPFPALGLAIALGMTACAPAAPPSPQSRAAPGAPAAPQPTLVFVTRGEPPSVASRELIPFSGALATMARVFNATLDFVDEREVPRPYLAEALPQLNTDNWRVLSDGRMETTYHLKPNLMWHDGQPLSAEDFVFAWRVYSTPEFGVRASPPIGQMEQIVAPDARTVLVRWRQLYAEAGVLDQTFQALPRHILEGPSQDLDPAGFSAHPFWSTEYVGLGPYRLTRWEPGAFIEAQAFDGYVLGKPKIERIKIVFIPDPNTAMANLLSGEAHFVAEFVLTATDGQTLEQQWAAGGGGVLLWAPVNLRLSVVQMRPEHADPPALLDVRVRRALAHAIDSATAGEILNFGKAVLTSTMTSPRAPYYGEIERVITKYPYDPRRAAQFLEEAGFTRGGDGAFAGRDGKSLSVGVWSSSGAKNEEEAAVFVDSLRRAGVDATQQVFPAAQLRDAQARAFIPGLSIRGGAADYVWFTSDQIPRPENRWQGNNRGGWSSAEYDRLFEAFVNTLDQAERIRLIGQMERVFTDQVGAIAHYFQPTLTAHVTALRGPVAASTPNAGGGRLYMHLWEWKP